MNGSLHWSNREETNRSGGHSESDGVICGGLVNPDLNFCPCQKAEGKIFQFGRVQEVARLPDGIVGYLGEENALPFLIQGLKRLEYCGYDSAGVAVSNGSVQELSVIPVKIRTILAGHLKIKEIASRYQDATNALYLGRGVSSR